MSLSGNLGFVPIDEVLRLLTRSHQQGSVDVTGNDFFGRVFVGRGGIDLATAWTDEQLHRLLANSQYTDRDALARIESGETTLAALAESDQAVIDLLREMTVESLFQIADRGSEFEVREGARTPYASPKSFDLEALLSDVSQREKDWSRVFDIIPNLGDHVRFQRDLGDREEVTVKVDDWKVLSEIGSGASVEAIAHELGTTDYWAARVAARLVENDLVYITESRVSQPPTAASTPMVDYEPEAAEEDEAVEAYVTSNFSSAMSSEGVEEITEHDGAPAWDAEPSYEDEPESVEEPVMAQYESPAAEFEPAQQDSEDDDSDSDEFDPNQSWWKEPSDEEGADAPDDQRTPEVVGEGLSEMPAIGSDESDDEVEEDTEAFLEKVFSELESSDSQGSEGHGLLRRRRMGTMRDLSSDS